MISIVIIGKNEALNLPKLYQSISKLSIKHEVIYVDSASGDDSVKVSQEHCDAVYTLEDSVHLCAAAGRFVGTQQAKHEWILYLDGDMELEDDFIQFLNTQEYSQFDPSIAGFIGYYDYRYFDGSNDENRLLQPANQIVQHFGGAVMLKREAVLAAGNWNPSVVANEEIDLYVRIQNLGYRVYGLDKKMVIHTAKKVSNLDTLLSMFWPQNRRFYGFGQVLVSQYKHGTLLKFMRNTPYPFIYLSLIALSPFYSISLLLLACVMVYVSVIKKWHYNIIFISDILRGISGIFQYSNFTPVMKETLAQRS